MEEAEILLDGTREMVRFEFRPYRRAFRQPLQTRYGAWRDRQGIVLRFSTGDRVGWGEIAPIEWFGTESWKAAIEFCQRFPSEPCAVDIAGISAQLPACQFGFACAWEGLEGELQQGMPGAGDWQLSYLLPAGEAALTAWRSPWQAGYRTFKWKIAVEPIERELEWFTGE
ncbi:MAG: o-succinylbenzoate synthase, partial [Leptolyngbyaceae cyanobacterium SL_7_1]|nr:o-succinylbenzoate synthase [Leptolyngbyaceae cyanobacterium SL_7_1]